MDWLYVVVYGLVLVFPQTHKYSDASPTQC